MSKKELEEGKLDIRVDLLYKVLLGFLVAGIIIHVVIALYFGSVNVMDTRYTLGAMLLVDLVCVLTAIVVCRIYF